MEKGEILSLSDLIYQVFLPPATQDEETFRVLTNVIHIVLHKKLMFSTYDFHQLCSWFYKCYNVIHILKLALEAKTFYCDEYELCS